MRALILVALLAVTVTAGSAYAEPWLDPTGRYTLDFVRLGWESAATQPPDYLEIASTSAREREKFLGCRAQVLGPLEGTTGFDQTRANAGSSNFGIENLRNVCPEAENPRVEHTTVDDVAVVDLRFTVSSHGGLHHHWRTFFLATPVGVVQHQIQCGGAMPVRPEDDAEIDNVLSTLRFLPN